MPGGVERIVERPAALWTRLNDHAQSLRMAWDGRAPGQNRLAKRRLPAEYSPALALWLVRLSACRSPGYGGAEGRPARPIVPAETFPQQDPTGPPGGRAAGPPACRNPQAEHRCSGNWTLWLCRRLGCYRRPARRPQSRANPRRPPRRRAAEGTQHGGLASVRGHARTPRSSSSPAIRRPAGPGPPPAAPVTSTSPLTRALRSVPGG